MESPGPMRKGKRNKYQVVVMLDPEHIAALDAMVAERYQSRSSLIRRAVVEFLIAEGRQSESDDGRAA